MTVKSNPYGPLFSPLSVHPRASAFQGYLPTEVATLATGIAEMSIVIPDTYNTGQSQANGTENNYARFVATLIEQQRKAS